MAVGSLNLGIISTSFLVRAKRVMITHDVDWNFQQYKPMSTADTRQKVWQLPYVLDYLIPKYASPFRFFVEKEKGCLIRSMCLACFSQTWNGKSHAWATSNPLFFWCKPSEDWLYLKSALFSNSVWIENCANHPMLTRPAFLKSWHEWEMSGWSKKTLTWRCMPSEAWGKWNSLLWPRMLQKDRQMAYVRAACFL